MRQSRDGGSDGGAGAQRSRRPCCTAARTCASSRSARRGSLARAVPFDGVCMLTLDPATLLPTGEVVRERTPARGRTAHRRDRDRRRATTTRFAALARSPQRAAVAQRGDGRRPRAQPAPRELRRPARLRRRAARRAGRRLGDVGRPDADAHVRRAAVRARDAALLATVSGCLAEGLRRAILFADAAAGRARGGRRPRRARARQLGRDGQRRRRGLARRAVDATASRSRRSSPPSRAARASSAHATPTRSPAPASARPSGRWLLVRGSALGDGAHTAVTIEPARPHELAPLIADAYGLTDRERAVTQLVAQGLPTNAIADRLHLSPWTVQDHLKSIFERVGVSTRGELVARVFFEHFAPRLGPLASREDLVAGREHVPRDRTPAWRPRAGRTPRRSARASRSRTAVAR